MTMSNLVPLEAWNLMLCKWYKLLHSQFYDIIKGFNFDTSNFIKIMSCNTNICLSKENICNEAYILESIIILIYNVMLKTVTQFNKAICHYHCHYHCQYKSE